jgi:glycosyltransferase involved in cell wall biosynthesis
MAFAPQDLTVLFITYNRSEMLERAVAAIRACSSLQGVKLVCSDDASREVHQQRIQRLGFDQVVSSDRNKGLAHNNNQGLKAVQSPYVLMVQDDCELVCPEAVERAMAVLAGAPTIGMVRLNGIASHFPLIQREVNGIAYWLCDHRGEAYAEVKRQSVRRRVYSDQPHIRRREVHESIVGYYAEGGSMERSEMDYEDRVDAQSDFYVAFLTDGHEDYFEHLSQEAGSFRTSKWQYKVEAFLATCVNKAGLRQSPLFGPAKSAYRKVQGGLMRLGVI